MFKTIELNLGQCNDIFAVRIYIIALDDYSLADEELAAADERTEPPAGPRGAIVLRTGRGQRLLGRDGGRIARIGQVGGDGADGRLILLDAVTIDDTGRDAERGGGDGGDDEKTIDETAHCCYS